jgi:hypothetical protein
MHMRSLCLSLVVLSVLGGDAALVGRNQAHAQARLVISQPRTDRQIELKIHGTAYYGYDWYDGLYGGRRRFWGGSAVGPGIQMLFPIVKNAIPSLNNPIYLGFFTDFLIHPDASDGYGHSFFSLAFGPLVQWRFVILDMFESGSFSAFANVGFGLWPWFTRDHYAGVDSTLFFGFPLFELGANIFFTRLFGLTLSFGYPSVKFGVSLAF